MRATRAIGTATMRVGTPGFQSLEQLKAEGIGISSDVFALGGVLTELFGGKPPGIALLVMRLCSKLL